MLKIWGGHDSPGYAYEGYVMVTWPTLPTNRGKRDNSHSPAYDFRARERLAHYANAKNIECEAMWLFLENTHLVHPSWWYTPGKFWYTLGCAIHSVDKHCVRLPAKCDSLNRLDWYTSTIWGRSSDVFLHSSCKGCGFGKKIASNNWMFSKEGSEQKQSCRFLKMWANLYVKLTAPGALEVICNQQNKF